MNYAHAPVWLEERDYCELCPRSCLVRWWREIIVNYAHAPVWLGGGERLL